MATVQPDAVPRAGEISPGRVVGALALLIPAIVGLIVGYLVPTIVTLRISVAGVETLGGGGWDVTTVGRAAAAIGYAAVLAIVPVAVSLLSVLIAVAAHLGGGPFRPAVRLILTLTLVGLAPFATAVAWVVERSESGGLDGDVAWLLPLVFWTSTLGFVCAVSTTAYVSALAREEGASGRWSALLAVAATLVVTVIAVAIQEGAYSLAFLTVSGPGDPVTPFTEIARTGFEQFRLGEAAVTAVLLLVALGVLGLIVVGMIALTGLRIEVLPRAPLPGIAQPAIRTTAGVLAILAAVGVVLATLATAWPWLSRSGSTELSGGLSMARALGNTWLPPLVTATVSVLVAALAAFGIGALRPLGRWSEVLLLPFAPWLLVGSVPLLLSWFDLANRVGTLGSPAGSVPPAWVCVPGLVLLTLLCRGQELRRRRSATAHSSASRLRWVVVPGLPLVGLVWLTTWVVLAQDPSWGYVSGGDLDRASVHLLVLTQVQTVIVGDGVAVGLIMPVGLLVALVLLVGALQVLYLDRLSIRTGSRD